MTADPIPVRCGPKTEWWRPIQPNRRTVRLQRLEDGEEATFDAKDGRPFGKDKTRFPHHRVSGFGRSLMWELIEAGKAKDGRRDIAERITEALLQSPPFGKFWIGQREVSIRHGKTRLRVDLGFLETLSRAPGLQRLTAGIEVKSCAADFKNDSKWDAYTTRFHRFAFACPENVIEPKDLPSRIGLYHWTGERIECVRAPVGMDELPAEIALDTMTGFALAGMRGETL